MSAYVISEVSVRNPALVERYREVAAASIAHHGGSYLVRGARPIAVEGRWPNDELSVIVEFPSMTKLRTWYRSPEYAEALELRPDAIERRLLFIEGVAQEGVKNSDHTP
jgi:uncharacterized protein (DUF1330 family)